MAYLTPPADVVAALDAHPPPLASLSPDRSRIALVEHDAHPPVELLARPILKLAGVRVDPARASRQHLNRLRSLRVLRVADGTEIDIATDGELGLPVWSHNSTRLAFTVDSTLWIADARTGEARGVDGIRVNDVLASSVPGGFGWSRDNRSLLVRVVPADRGPAPDPPRAPRVEETAGKQTQMATFQDLLRSERDDSLFEHFATSQLVRVDAESLATGTIGEPDLLTGARESPDGEFLLVSRIRHPFSYRVPWQYFSRTVEVWTRDGVHVRTVADLPVSDEVPRQGVPTGPRSIGWQELRAPTLVWSEALDGGDPKTEVPHRDRLLMLDAPFRGEPRELLRTQHRLVSVDWTAREEVALVREHDRDRRWRTTWLVDLSRPDERRVLFDLSLHDVYGDPGQPMHDHRPDGTRTILQDGDCVFLVGRGASEQGMRPFVDRFNLDTRESERIWQCDEDAFEMPVAFLGGELITRRESPVEPPNLYVGGRALTRLEDPHPSLTTAPRRLLRYGRDDGVPLSGMLFLPPGYVEGTRVPVLVWAYPMDYSDPDTAGQVRVSDKGFLQLQGATPLVFLLRGYAVLLNATMPVVGDPDTMNDTFVEQVCAAARAAIDTLDDMGVVDRGRVVVSGHSYGGFMTANLLAHTDLFAAGIARSGAYNRSLTPFGFQTERRSYWEAPQVYHRVSPFSYADKISAPILLIHGEEDNNTGTFPIQSERLFQAIQGHGGTARLVTLPHESHGYRARESVLHAVAEMLAWAERWVVAPAVPAVAAGS